MLLRYLRILAVALPLGLSTAFAQSCRVSPAAVLDFFDLTDSFGDDVSLEPFDEAGAFPWWVFRGGSRPVAVIEDVRVIGSANGYSTFLDAQYLDRNDLIVSAPVGARQARSWQCAE